MDGHTRKGCFKLIGYPDWFKTKNKTSGQNNKPLKGNNTKIMGNIESLNEFDTPLECLEGSYNFEEISSILNSLQQEVHKLVKGKCTAVTSINSIQ